MKYKNCQFYPKKRRGLSSVIGALLFVVLMVATFSVLGIALNTQTDIVSIARDVSGTDLKKQQEEFVIAAILQKPAESLQVNVTNKGQNPVEIFTMIITNSSDIANGFPTKTYEIPSDTSFVASGDNKPPTDVVKTLDLKLKLAAAGETEIYNLKLVSSLGIIKKVNVVCDDTVCDLGGGGGIGGLTVQLIMDGPNGINTKNSTVIMFVTNTGDVPLTNVAPVDGNPTPDCDDMWSVSPPGVDLGDISPCDLDSITPISMVPGQTAVFKWDGRVSGDIGDVFTFCNTVTGQDPDLNPITSNTSCDEMTVIDPNDCGGCGPGGESIILIDDLLIRPSIFMVIPSPFGATDDADNRKGLWGINLANPTDEPMSINKVTIAAYPPGGQSQDNVFSGAKIAAQACLEEDISPDLGPDPSGYWDCPRDNIVLWQNVTNPLILAANSTESFMVKVKPAGIKPGPTAANLDALIVQANVYTTFGSFGKAGYQSTMYLPETSIVNVYLSDTIDSLTDFQGNRNDIPENTTQTFKIVLADLDEDPSTTINIGARLIINVPREWVFDGFNSCDGFDAGGPCDEPIVNVHGDGSTQIIGTTTVPIGDATFQARTISFDAISPDVKAPRLYVMYVLADGTVTVGGEPKTIGPLNEIVLNVDP